jgi:hypothetical protein
LLLESLERDVVLSSCVSVLRLNFANLLEICHRLLELVQCGVSLASAVIALDVFGVLLDCFTGVEEGDLVLLEAQTGKRPVAVVNCLLFGGYLAKNGFRVLLNGVLVFAG